MCRNTAIVHDFLSESEWRRGVVNRVEMVYIEDSKVKGRVDSRGYSKCRNARPSRAGARRFSPI